MPTTPGAPVMGVREWALLIVLSVLWGGSFYYFKVLVAELPPLTIVLARLALAAILMNLLIVVRRGFMPRAPRVWASFAVMGLLNNIVPMALIVWAETRISSGLASILNATTPVFAVIAAHFLTRNEKLNWHRGLGVFCGLLGVVLLIGPAALARGGRYQILGDGACLAAALTYAFAGFYGRRFKGMPALTIATGQITASSLVLLPIALIVDRPWGLPAPSAHAWQALIALAVLSTSLAYVIYFKVLAAAGATNVLLVTLLVPVSAVLLGVFFLNETLSPQIVGGTALIALGLAAIDGRAFFAIRSRWVGPRS
jgi:drug/metabolite transporter (DMT)-like permease